MDTRKYFGISVYPSIYELHRKFEKLAEIIEFIKTKPFWGCNISETDVSYYRLLF